ncbi:hypothetical protein TSAR_005835, partial [Trichomalopsis sarcophagae]
KKSPRHFPKCLKKSEAPWIDRKEEERLSPKYLENSEALWIARGGRGALYKVQMAPWRVNNFGIDLSLVRKRGQGQLC